jgi:hypothetical protein
MGRDIGRTLLYGVIGGLIVTILAIWAGTRNPLTLLYVSLGAFIAAAIVFEIAQLPWVGRAAAKFPYEVRLTVSHKNAVPKPAPVEIERGFLDYERDFLQSTFSAARVLDRITSELNAQSQRIKDATPRLVKAKGASIEVRRRVTDAIARDMDQFALRLEGLERDYRTKCNAMTSNGLGLVRTSPDVGELMKLAPSLAGVYDSTKGYRDSTATTKATMQQGRATNVSQNVNRAYERVIAVLDMLLKDADGVLKYATEAQAVIRHRAGANRTT